MPDSPQPTERASPTAAASLAFGPKPSAMGVALLRAAHQVFDRPLVLEDPVAMRIVGPGAEAALRRDPARFDTPRARSLRASLVVRSRLADDEWSRACRRGVRQYVILGAGLDTTAYRRPIPADCRFFEVDLPDTQAWKRACLRTAGIAEPTALTYVPVDFERTPLAAALATAGLGADEPTFFSWLGVTMYLDEAAIADTLRVIGALPAGSGVVFDYAVTPVLLTAGERRAVEELAARTAGHSEPWKAFFDPETIAALLRTAGFTHADDLGAAELNGRYLGGRTDGLCKSGITRLIAARV